MAIGAHHRCASGNEPLDGFLLEPVLFFPLYKMVEVKVDVGECCFEGAIPVIWTVVNRRFYRHDVDEDAGWLGTWGSGGDGDECLLFPRMFRGVFGEIN